jgi:Domain of unknown function (DUF1877)
MGMTCTVCRVTDEEIDRLLEEPAGLADFLDPDDGSAPRVRTVRPKGLLGLALRLFPITITEVVPDPRADVAPRVIDRDRSVDIDKGWHGLHFLFTGTADGGEEPACYLVRGGEDLDDEYPDAIWTPHAPEEDSPREWLLECFGELRRFMSQVAATHVGVIVHIG